MSHTISYSISYSLYDNKKYNNDEIFMKIEKIPDENMK